MLKWNRLCPHILSDLPLIGQSPLPLWGCLNLSQNLYKCSHTNRFQWAGLKLMKFEYLEWCNFFQVHYFLLAILSLTYIFRNTRKSWLFIYFCQNSFFKFLFKSTEEITYFHYSVNLSKQFNIKAKQNVPHLLSVSKSYIVKKQRFT